jgi:DNA-binding NarL/FixJ family response regulator
MSEFYIRDPRLTPREKQIVDLLLAGCGNAEIAKELKITPHTVKLHFNRIFLRFGICDGFKRVKLAVMMYRAQRLRADG